MAALIWLLVVLCPAGARAFWGDSDKVFGLNGSVRTLVLVLDNYDFRPYFGHHRTDLLSQTILRLTVAGRPSSRSAYEFHLVQAYTFNSSPAGGTAGGLLGSGGSATRYRVLGLSRDWYQDNDHLASLWVDRLNFKLSIGKFDITLGRQAITFGKAYFWNPLDVFLPFDPRQFDREYKAGVDALRIDLSLGNFSGLNFIAAAGRELTPWGTYIGGDRTWHADWYGSAFLARAFTTIKGWDLALQGGKVYGGYQLGAGVVGEIFKVQFRAEVAYLWAENSAALPSPLAGKVIEDNLTAVLGLGGRFPSSLDIEIEYLYNGAGDPEAMNAAMLRFIGGAGLHLGRHLLGLTVSYDLLPILKGRLAVIYSISDSSIQVQPSLTWSVSDNSEVILGAAINRGRRPERITPGQVMIRSEFGTYPDYYYLQWKFYF